jgi:hypothetical protein
MSRSRTVTDPAPPIIPGSRPTPPPELSPEQQAIWSAIVARLPVGWFSGENLPMLRELCRHIDFANWLAADIAQARSEIIAQAAAEISRSKTQDRLLSLLRAHGYQTERIGNLSTKLRLTKASRYTRDAEGAAIASRNASAGSKPWEDWGSGRSQ